VLLPSPIFQRRIWMLNESGLADAEGESVRLDAQAGWSLRWVAHASGAAPGAHMSPWAWQRWRRNQGGEADVDPRRADLGTPQ
jgi:ABC-type nitrate/sulfonate/bicarbonate transport system substrate-binding protein